MIALKLPIRFDVKRLQQDLEAVQAVWVRHHRPDHSTHWHAVQLRSIGGDPDNGFYDHNASVFQFTPAYKKCWYVPQVLEALGCPTKRVRFLRLAAGASIKRHIDPYETLYYGQLRLHVPVVTSPRVRFYVAGARVRMGPGELWYLNALHRHWVYNDGNVDRIHLVIDCVVNQRLRELIEQNATPLGLISERIAFALRPGLILKDRLSQRIVGWYEAM